MAIESRTGQSMTGTGAVASTVEVTFSSAMAAAPTFILVYFSGRTEDGTDGVGRLSHKRGIGFVVSASDRRQISTFSLDASASADTGARVTAADCIAIMSAAGTVDGAFDLTSSSTTGFILDVTNQFSTSYAFSYWAITGTTSVEGGAITASLSTGNVDYTLSGAFQGDVLLMLAVNSTAALPATAIDSTIMFGAASGASNQFVIVGGSNDAATTTDSNSAGLGGDIVAIPASNVATIVARAQFVQFNSDGFRLNWTEVSGNAHNIFYVVIKGGSWSVNESLTQTDTTTDITISGLGFTPVGGVVASVCAAEDATNTLHAHDQWSFGAWSSTTERNVHAILDEDNAADSETSAAAEYDAVYANMDTSSAIQGLMDLKSIDTGAGATFIMDDADPAQYWFGSIMVGNVAAAATVKHLAILGVG